MSDFKIGSKVILVNSGMEGTVIDINMNNPFPYKVETPIGKLFAGEYAMKLKRLNDATPAEHDAVNYYKKLDERLPDDFWDEKPEDESEPQPKYTGCFVEITTAKIVDSERGEFLIGKDHRGKIFPVEREDGGFVYVSDGSFITAIPKTAITRYFAKDPSKQDDEDERINIIGQNGNDGLHYEAVSKPKHYAVLDCEVIDIIADTLTQDEFRGYCLGNIIKYRMRAGKKGDALVDIAKANEYEHIWERFYGAY